MAAEDNFNFRRAKIEDIKEVRQMIQEFAEFHNVHGSPELSIEDFIRDSGLTGGTEYFHLYLLELKSEVNDKPTPIGYAVCYVFWSSWVGKTYFLENLFVKPEYRNIGAGRHFLCEIAAIVKEMGYKYLGFHVASWNSATQFYKNLGATIKSSQHFRMQENQISVLKEQLKN